MNTDILDLILSSSEDDDEKAILNILAGNDKEQDLTINNGDILTVLPLKNRVLFPGVLLPVTIVRPKVQKQILSVYRQEKQLAVLCQRKETEDPKDTDLYTIGTSARILRMMNMPDQSVVVILEGIERIAVEEFSTTKTGAIRARIHAIPEIFPNKKEDKELIAIGQNIKDQTMILIKSESSIAPDARMMVSSITHTPTLINYLCVNLGFSLSDKQRLLEYTDIQKRALELLSLLNREVEMQKMKEEIQSKTQDEISKDQREYFLHQQLEAIHKELGDDGAQVVSEMEERAKSKKWSKEVDELFHKELMKLRRTNPHSSDYSVQQNWLETMLELPWNEYTQDNFDIKHAREVLDRDHYGIDKVKERIIEHLAVLKQRGDMRSPILCLYGPPGVGKTSLGKSVAEALGRKYARVSLGGLHDEAEIRGHRRTYIGSMPGRIIENIKKVQTGNPVFVLDEIDKIGADYKGDPTSALLEVLDPEQNSEFHDNFLDVDYDLSKVLFIATANSLDTIPRPLLDRMELIEMTGYCQEEKQEIAKRHLLPKQLKEHGLKANQLRLNKAVMDRLIDDYTRESGVRSLDRTIGKVCRKVVTKIAMEEEYNVSVTTDDLKTYLGYPRFTRDIYEGNQYIGVVTGLAWTSVGGEILFIEASLSKAKAPSLTLTGNLGDVMKESATLAMGYIRAHAKDFGIAQKDIDTHAVHIHVPEGATPKDGPSAGITITTALVSAFTGRKVRAKIAMTGEMTLRGKVLPIGGVKEKILAAKRAGITDLVMCEDNRKNVEEIPELYTKGLHFHYVRDIKDVIDYAII